MAQGGGFLLGLDVGSTTAKVVVLDADLHILHEGRTRTHGRPLETALTLLRAIPSHPYTSHSAGVATTGTAGRLLAEILGGSFINEIVAHAVAACNYHPEARTVLDMGGQDTKLVHLGPGPGRAARIKDFNLNTLCAAGTGSFLDQQAQRLGLTIDEFSVLALRSKGAARLAGRCTVFAKSDMIHLQQAAVPDCDIVAGLCLALVRNLKANLARGKRVESPIVFQGGVAANAGVREALRAVFHLSQDELIIPPHYRTMGAIGAVLEARRETSALPSFRGTDALEAYLEQRPARIKRLKPLARQAGGNPPDCDTHHPAYQSPWSSFQDRPLYLGIDVGSISTKMVLVGPGGEIVARSYGPTEGKPLSAIQRRLAEFAQQLSPHPGIAAVGTTGSGRYLAADFVGADTVVNEITAQAHAAVALDPLVDTIFEIGGQDSKYIRLKDGTVVDFMMNRACAAGTGSFLEEQAGRLNVPLDEFGPVALKAEAPVRMGERCTVFMESDLVHYLQQGAPTQDLVAGLCYAIVHNYLNKVVEDRPLGQRIFYQGATALNVGVVAAFEAILGKRITVPPYCDVTGALGAAILAGERSRGPSRFRGFDLTNIPYEVRTFECQACPNQCSISRVHVADRPPLFYGGRCERYERRIEGQGHRLPDLVGEREERLQTTWACASLEEARGQPRGAVGLPLALFYRDWLPFFATFLRELGFGPVISGPTSKALIRKGVETVVTEPCFPVKVAHGHIQALLDQGLRRIFLPSIINLPGGPDGRPGQVCPYVQSLPYTVLAAIDFQAHSAEVLSLPLALGGAKGVDRMTRYRLARLLRVRPQAVTRAIKAGMEAQHTFHETLLQRGREILSSMGPNDRAVVLVGRAYNALDPGANLALHQKLRELGVLALPMDLLPLDAHMAEVPEADSMYWRYGLQILAASVVIRKDPRLRAVYITNFGCGPDSFLLHFFREIQGEKSFLEIEIDEHSADAGALTRLEAFLDTVHTSQRPPSRSQAVRDCEPSTPDKTGKPHKTATTKAPFSYRTRGEREPGRDIRHPVNVVTAKRTIYIPPMCDHAHALAAAIVACGGTAKVLPPTDAESVALGLRYTSGKECYPAILTTGDMAKMALDSGFDPQQAAFFMPSGAGPCRFGQYHRLHRRILDGMGLAEVPIYSPSQDITLYDELGLIGSGFSRLAWQGVVCCDLLDRLFRATRPYARDQKTVKRLYQQLLDGVCEALKNRHPLEPVLRKARSAIEDLTVTAPNRRLVVGIVGEIYTRANPKANAFLVRELEALGAEVWLPTVSEWILYINFTARRRARRAKAWRQYMKLSIENLIQIRDTRRLEAALGPLPGGREPLTREILAWASPYVSDEFEGETVLSVGKAVSYLNHGVSGLINVLPFTCMPGTIVNSLVTRLQATNGGRPFLALTCDGQQDTGRRLRLEAFLHQARRYALEFHP